MTEETKEQIRNAYIKRKGWTLGRMFAERAIQFAEAYEESSTLDEVTRRTSLKRPNSQIRRLEAYTGLKFKRFPMGGCRLSNKFKKKLETELKNHGLEIDWNDLKIQSTRRSYNHEPKQKVPVLPGAPY